MPRLTKDYLNTLMSKAVAKASDRAYTTLPGYIKWPMDRKVTYLAPKAQGKEVTGKSAVDNRDLNNARLREQFATERTTNILIFMPDGRREMLVQVPVVESGGGAALKGPDIKEGTLVAVSVNLEDPTIFPLVVGMLPDRESLYPDEETGIKRRPRSI